MRIRATWLLPLGLLAAFTSCGPAGPAIQEISPAKGEANVAGDAPIKITFNHDMDRASVEARFVLRPPIDGCDPATCPVKWNGRTLTMAHPLHQFAANTRYRVTLKPGYRDNGGQVEGLEHFWEFTTESAPGVGAVTPSDGSTGVAVDADITVQLTRSVLVPAPPALSLIAEADPVPVAYRVAIAPDDSRRLVVSPVGLLRPRTRYTIHVSAGVQDAHHNPLGTERDFHFTTGALDLTRSLGFLVRDPGGTTASRVALLRPPAGLNAPAPSLRLIYTSDHPVASFGWSPDATSLYVLHTSGVLEIVPLDGSAARNSGILAASMATDPSQDELAYVTTDGTLHIWRPEPRGASNDVAVSQAGIVSGRPVWSGDGRRLAFAATGARGGLVLRQLDRETLSASDVPGVALPNRGAVLAWSFDGTALALTRSGMAAPEVWVYRPLAAQGTGLQKLGALDTSWMSWSADGGTVFAAGSAAAGRPSLIQSALGQPVEGQTAGFSPVRGSRAGDTAPEVPTFDRRIAFVRQAAGVPQLWIMNNDGTGVTQLTFATYDKADRLITDGVDQPRWSPGGSNG
ncbi:MAG TPA: Ig-like domain-containing protein [Candidatus Dormibacteraeota bacterium]|nr:Ig-like domain-containing protein [Candidatus Dormibacteraeota bacterium]